MMFVTTYDIVNEGFGSDRFVLLGFAAIVLTTAIVIALRWYRGGPESADPTLPPHRGTVASVKDPVRSRLQRRFRKRNRSRITRKVDATAAVRSCSVIVAKLPAFHQTGKPAGDDSRCL